EGQSSHEYRNNHAGQEIDISINDLKRNQQQDFDRRGGESPRQYSKGNRVHPSCEENEDNQAACRQDPIIVLKLTQPVKKLTVVGNRCKVFVEGGLFVKRVPNRFTPLTQQLIIKIVFVHVGGGYSFHLNEMCDVNIHGSIRGEKVVA